MHITSNINTINGINNTTFGKSNFNQERESSYYLLLNSAILKRILDVIYMKEVGGI